ncbi:MAG: hypothetical protein LBR58_10955 [Propionibacteriaceae bacterium]|jgi:hypothetical protein|nr:hypothetical protein [Propionibacteriaceae bacterium]
MNKLMIFAAGGGLAVGAAGVAVWAMLFQPLNMAVPPAPSPVVSTPAPEPVVDSTEDAEAVEPEDLSDWTEAVGSPFPEGGTDPNLYGHGESFLVYGMHYGDEVSTTIALWDLDGWHQFADLPGEPEGGLASAVQVSWKFYAICIVDGEYAIVSYDEDADEWTELPLPVSLQHANIFGLYESEQKLFALGGVDTMSAFERYDPATGQWEDLYVLPADVSLDMAYDGVVRMIYQNGKFYYQVHAD